MNGSDELFQVTEPFTTLNQDFKSGKGFDAEALMAEPQAFPNQLLYCSSAGSTDQYFFKKYREFSIRMMAGDKRYFCADIPCDVVMNATMHGKKWPVPLLTQEKIDQAMREDKEAALREYYNIFSREGGDGCIVKRSAINKNSVVRPPLLYNDTGTRAFGLFYDPARAKDNSVVLIAEFYQDRDVGWKMRICNLVNLFNRMSKNKTPATTPNQIKEVKKLLIDYNGKGALDYENIMGLWIDAGSGGAGVNISDFFWEEWEDDAGVKHRGMIDAEYSPEEAPLYPNAIRDKMRLLQPTKYKVEMYRALIEMMDNDLIEWTNDYDGKGYINMLYEIDTKTGVKTPRYHEPTEKEVREFKKKGIDIVREQYYLDENEEMALKQIDAMKTEIVNIYRYKQSSGGDRFDLAPDKANQLHDDRAYVLAMAAYMLQTLRRSHLVTRQTNKGTNLIDMFQVTPRKRFDTMFG